MQMRTRVLLLTLAFLLCRSAAFARDGAGALTFIKAPSSTQPQFAQPGGTIIVDVAQSVHDSCACRFHLYLDTAGDRVEIAMISRLTDPATGVYSFSATIPEGMDSGLYTLIAQKGANNDAAINAVSVIEDFPDAFTVMHIHDPSVDENTGPALERAVELAASLKPAFIIVTGNIAASNAPAHVTRAMDILKKMPAPVFAVSSSGDVAADAQFGPLPRAFAVGGHAFLLAADADPQPGACPELPMLDVLGKDKLREAELKLFHESAHSLYYDAQGQVQTVITKPGKNGCTKSIKETAPPVHFKNGSVRIYTFEKGKLKGRRDVPLPR